MDVDKPTTPADRAMHVLQACANQAIEGFYPDESDRKILAQYVIGTATLADLLNHAQKFATAAREGKSS